MFEITFHKLSSKLRLKPPSRKKKILYLLDFDRNWLEISVATAGTWPAL